MHVYLCTGVIVCVLASGWVSETKREDMINMVKATHLAIRTMTRNGSLAMVNKNMAKAGPKEMKVQPKNSMTVILTF